MKLTKSSLNHNKWFLLKPKLVGILVFLFFCIIFSLILSQQYHISKKAKNDAMDTNLQAINKSIEQSLKKNYVDALTLALTINDKGVPEHFQSIGKQILASDTNIDAVQLVPNGIIRFTYPLKGNEGATGINILTNKKYRFEALKAIETRKMYFAGPFELNQGGLGILGRLAIYKNNKFWGFSAILIRLNTLLEKPEIEKLDQSKYYFQFSKINPITKKETFFLNTKTKLNPKNAVSSFIPDGDWKLYLFDKKPNELLLTFAIRSFLALILASLIGFLTTSFFKKPAELEILLKKQADKLLKNEIKFKSVFDQAAVGITYVDTNSGQLLEANKKYCDLLGYTEQEIKQKKIQSIVHPDDLQESFLNFEKLKKGIIREYSTERRHITKSNDIIWIKLTISPLWEDNTYPTNHIAIVEDVTERKLAEEAIFNSQQRIESLINTVDGIVWECNAKTLEFTFISKKVEDILGYTSEEWINTPDFWVKHIYHKDKDFTLKYCAEQTAQKLNHDFEYRMIAKDGSIVWLRDIVNVIVENGEAKNLRGIMIDVTKNKEIENDLNNSFNLVSEQNKRLLNFSYIVSHNLRSHTSNISSIVDLIDSSESEEEKEEMIQLLKSVSDSLNETMLNLNEIVNIQTNVGLVTENLNLKQYLDNTLAILSDQIELKGVTVVSSIKNDIEVNYNPAYLESVLYNLISNAIRYSHHERHPTIHIDCFNESKKTVLQISDNGIGIDLNKNGHKIFGMYKKFSTHKDSKGIGLFITKNQIDAMGGSITVESEPNLGTTFKVYIS
ncbi:sensor histidine kinase [Flavobacterium undicola]|uniref:sensor histidine kinase n=1 Tax=Flavobacterium undicola TaxID=1932779 RepID=UPI0013776A0D|nr:PAS domain S-box protein [Flavobacterium undicola]MBA0883493.1 PAS domain S-box protein [Flavobacterium undicola]